MSVQSLRHSLTEEDIRRLFKGGQPEERAQAVHRLCRQIGMSELSEEDRGFVDQVLGMLSQDAVELVRKALAVTLRNSPHLPHEVAMRLARDVEAVALPVIRSSPVLNEQDLVEILLTSAPAKQVAVSGRPSLTPTVCEAIAEHACKQAVKTMAENDGAVFSGKAYAHTLRRFHTDEDVTGALVHRPRLPVIVAEKLVTLVTGELFDHLVNNHELPPALALDIATRSRERATIDLVEQAARQRDLGRFAQQLNLAGRLTPSLVLRALCMGQMSFVEWSLSELSGVAHHKVWQMLHDAGNLGLKALFERAALPQRLMPVFRIAIEVYHATPLDGSEDDQVRFRRLMIERVLTQMQQIPPDDFDYLMEKLDATREQPTPAQPAPRPFVPAFQTSKAQRA
jgi:uncharacterized protein (DUF2336 family)